MFRQGDKIGPYELIERIGKGAFGVVWLARKQSALATTNVAIKIPAEGTIDLDAVKREASVWVSASGHPNVLPMIDADVYGDNIVIVSEYAPDGTLADWLDRHGGRAPTMDDAVEIVSGILAGLDHLHRRGIIHRDLKPENILLQGDTPRLADFGIARVLKGTSHSAAASGTPVYMPPEAFDGKRGEHTDIWSAGVIFYQLITGRLPFNGDGITALMGAIVTKEPEPIPNCPPHIWAVIGKALAKDPSQRFRTAADMRRAVRHASISPSEHPTRSFDPDISMHPTIKTVGTETQNWATETLPEARETIAQETPRATRRGRTLWAALASVIALAVIGGGFYFYKAAGGSRQQIDARSAEIFESKERSWTGTILSGQGQNGGIHEISDSESSAQVWSTAQCLAAVLASGQDLAPQADNIRRGFAFIEGFRRGDPSPGWNYYGNSSPFTVTEIGAWVVLAETFAVDNKTPVLGDTERQQMTARIVRDLDEIVQRQDKNGGWRPIREDQPGFIRTYSSAIALWSLLEAKRSPAVSQAIGTRYDDNIRRGINWLLLTYKSGQGWVPNPNRLGQTGRFDGLNAQILFILSRAETVPTFSGLKLEQAYTASKREFIANRELADRTAGKNNSSIPDIDIRFGSSEFMGEGSTFLWFPWTLAALSQLTRDEALTNADRSAAAALRSDILDHNSTAINNYVEDGGLMYIYAENLFCSSVYLDSLKN